jgi:hypothetical protein
VIFPKCSPEVVLVVIQDLDRVLLVLDLMVLMQALHQTLDAYIIVITAETEEVCIDLRVAVALLLLCLVAIGRKNNLRLHALLSFLNHNFLVEAFLLVKFRFEI